MKKLITILLLFAFTITKASGGLFDFLNKPSRQGSSVLIIFYKEDCPYCQNLSTTLKKEAGFTNLLHQNFNIQRIDITTPEGRALADKFKVHAVPTIINYQTQTGSYEAIVGFRGVNKLASILKINYAPAIEKKAVLNNTSFDVCGNAIIEPPEMCDDGNVVNGDGCDNNCTISACGNGITAGSEACDDGNSVNGDGCDNNCRVTGCGNGIVTSGETCDDGNQANGDGCDNNCTVTRCGNGIISAGEFCDDGNTVSGDGCDNNCTTTGCGNGVVTPGETCDDGNQSNGDGCDNNCSVTSCGNGITTAGEACDDGNQIAGDGCSPICQIENPNARGVAINTDGSPPALSAFLDVQSTTKGVLIPRMSSAQRTAIESPDAGLLVFDNTSNSFWYYKSAVAGWMEIGGSGNTAFRANNATGQSFFATFSPVFTSEQYDEGNNFASNIFTIPQTGVYELHAYATFTFSGGGSQTIITLRIQNNSTTAEYGSNSIIIPAGFSGSIKLEGSANTKLGPGTPVGIRILVSGTPGTQTLSSITFSGSKVY